jgi:hypothetical protein
MNYFAVFIVSAFSIALPAIAAALRIKRLQGRFMALAVLLWAGLINETISYLAIARHGNNSINSNIYTLAEFLIMLWLFYRAGENRAKKYFLVAAWAGTVVWMVTVFELHSIMVHNTLSRVLSSLVIVYLSIDKISETIFNEPGNRRKPLLWLWFSFFTYYAYQAFISIFEIFPMGISNEFYLRLYLILSVINFLINLVYTAVILWIPKQTGFTLR